LVDKILIQDPQRMMIQEHIFLGKITVTFWNDMTEHSALW